MREIFKSKFMMGFMVLMLMLTLFNSKGVEIMNNNNINKNEIILNK